MLSSTGMSDQDGQESLKRKTEGFLREFFQKGESLVRELIIENDRLRKQLVGRPATSPDGAAPSGSSGEGGDPTVEELMQRVDSLERECDEIRRLAGHVEEQSGDYRDRLDMLEREHYNLACMYVAGEQFQTATTFDEVLRTVTEILLNFVGIGAFTLHAIDEERQVAFPVVREGGDPRERAELPLGEGFMAELGAHGRPWKAGDPTFSDGSTLCNLPLVSGTRLVGVARLESFLTQKTEFSDDDYSLLALISGRAGTGLETAWIRAHAKEVPLQREAVEHLVGA